MEEIFKPTPDPTSLTTEAQIRSNQAERDYTNGQLDVVRERLRGIDRATELLNQTVNRVPTELQSAISHQHDLTWERFKSVDSQFKERDTRGERESRDNKVAVDAAFAAQKEAAAKQDEANQKAIDKSEKNTQEKIDKQSDLSAAEIRSLNEKVADLKDRVLTLEAIKLGGKEQTSGFQDNIRVWLALAVVFITIVSFFANYVTSK